MNTKERIARAYDLAVFQLGLAAMIAKAICRHGLTTRKWKIFLEVGDEFFTYPQNQK